VRRKRLSSFSFFFFSFFPCLSCSSGRPQAGCYAASASAFACCGGRRTGAHASHIARARPPVLALPLSREPNNSQTQQQPSLRSYSHSLAQKLLHAAASCSYILRRRNSSFLDPLSLSCSLSFYLSLSFFLSLLSDDIISCFLEASATR
jgi:hypothetical protein